MTNKEDQQAAEAKRLLTLLDERREELESIAGVVGTGVGFASDSDLRRVVIQIFVASPTLIDEVQQKGVALMGEDIPFETTFMPTPAADGGQHEGGN